VRESHCSTHLPHQRTNPRNALSEIRRFVFSVSKQGYKESTIRPAVSTLKAIAKRIDLFDTEAVKA